MTNIWDALRLGINEAQKYKEYNTCLMLFKMETKYKSINGNYSYT